MANDARGHRKRLWYRFQKSGLRDAFAHPYEKLEFMLTFSIPQADTKPMAKALLKTFGSLSAVLNAPPHKLQAIDGIGPKTAHFLGMFREVALAVDEEQLARRNLLKHPDLVKTYLQHELGWEEAEFLVVLYLDTRCRLIAKERLFRGTLNRLPSYPRELAKEALAHNAAGIIMAHNHPSGDATPSGSDGRATREMEQALKLVGVQLHDHFVVGRDEVVSVRERGLFVKPGNPYV